MQELHVPENHLRVIRALQNGPRAPDRLRRRILEMDATAVRRRAPSMASVRDRLALRGLRPALVAGVASVVLAMALALALFLSGPGGATVVEAAELSLRPSIEAAPTENPQQPALLQRSFAGVNFPAWSKEFRWRAVGARSDELDGRKTETVFYTHTHHRIGYTVISGEPTEAPAHAEKLSAGGLELHRFRLGRQDVVTFERNGRTCVLSGDVHDPDTLVKLAAWQGDGAIAF
jgi:hypothetical protein